ncbi:MAG: hypothetical protein WAK71_21785 [Streptosporangiaceae bacterium]
MVSTTGGRARRLIITAVAAAGLGAGLTGVALASTGSSGAAGTTSARTTSASSSPSTSASPSTSGGTARTPASGTSGTHHCTHMGSGSGSARPGTPTGS